MAIPSSGALTLSTIQTEFGGTNPIGLDEYYAGGANVPSGTTGTNGAVPSSGAISISAFYGTSSASVNFVDVTVESRQSVVATAGYRVDADGFDYARVQAVYSALAQWVTPASSGNNYEVFATIVTGSVSFGTIGSWVATSGSPEWTRTTAGAGTIQSVSLSMQVRAVGSSTVLDTWTVSLEAERF